MDSLRTAAKQSAFVFALLVLVSSRASSQFIGSDPFPAMPLKILNADIITADSSFVVFGEIGSNSTDVFDNWYGLSAPFLLANGSTKLSSLSFLPDSNLYWSMGFGGYEDVPNYSVAVGQNGTTLICWSKVRLDVSDVPPTYLETPVVRGAVYSGGTLIDSFRADTSLNPQVAFDKNNVAHMVWENVTPLDSFTQSRYGRFIRYSSEVVYTTRSPEGALSAPISVGKGFSPHVRIASDNSVHIIYFGADSSSASALQLFYVRSNGSAFGLPKPLHVFPVNYSSRNSYITTPVLGWSVDSSLTLHFAWSASSVWPNTKFYHLYYNDEEGVSIDSSDGYPADAVRFLFRNNGDVEAAWLSRTNVTGPDQFFFSSSKTGRLFNQFKVFTSLIYAQSFSLFEESGGKIDAIFPGARMIQLLKDLESGKDTLNSVPTEQAAGTSFFLDGKNELWFLGSSDSVYSLLHFPLDDAGRAPVFTLPLQEGTVWQYQTYMTEDPYGMPNGYAQIKLQKDTLVANGRCYTRVPFNMFNVLYLRNDGLRTYRYSPTDTSEFVCYDFSKKRGDTVVVFSHEWGNSEILCTDVEQWPLFGSSHTMMSFRGTAPFVNEAITDSIGISGWGDGLANAYELIGAIVGGVKYGTVLSVGEEPELRPAIFSLSQNYPNPFNPVTSIRFTVGQPQLVSLKIYDVLGREVASLLHEKKNPGTYIVAWNAGSYSSGVYFYRLQAGSMIQTKKMVLLK